MARLEDGVGMIHLKEDKSIIYGSGFGFFREKPTVFLPEEWKKLEKKIVSSGTKKKPGRHKPFR